MFDIITESCMPTPKPECPEGMLWDAATGTCYMEDVTVMCGPGQILVGGVCVEMPPFIIDPPGPDMPEWECPEGMVFNVATNECVYYDITVICA